MKKTSKILSLVLSLAMDFVSFRGFSTPAEPAQWFRRRGRAAAA